MKLARWSQFPRRGGACAVGPGSRCVKRTLRWGRTWGGRGLGQRKAEFAEGKAGPALDTGTSAGEAHAGRGGDPGKAEFELRPGSLMVHFALSGLIPVAEGCGGGIRTPRLTRSRRERTSYPDLGGTDDACQGPDSTKIIALQDAYFCLEETLSWRPRGCHLQPLSTWAVTPTFLRTPPWLGGLSHPGFS